MAEIKSTLELAMERTKKIAISGEEREEIKRKETLQKVTSLFHRYTEGHLPLNEILKEIERLEEKTKNTVKEGLRSQLIDTLSLISLNDEHERHLKLIESLENRNIDAVKQKLHGLLIQYRKEREKAKREARAQLLETLRREGISGSAVEPNIEMNQLWEKESAKLDHRYDIELKKIKEQLRGL